VVVPAGVRRARPGARRGGVAGLAAQQLAVVVALRLAAGGQEGSVVVLAVATALFLLPWAVLAVPVATSAFPALSAAVEHGDETAYAGALAGAVRSVLLAMAGSAAVLAVAAPAGADLLVQGVPGAARSADLAAACEAFAPGLVGYGLLAVLVRAGYARGRVRTAAAATVATWLAVAVTDVALVRALSGRRPSRAARRGATPSCHVGGWAAAGRRARDRLPGRSAPSPAGAAARASPCTSEL
jgi:putative peptidoglycan lipid II flippase